jgi:hypothetical protein
MEYLARLLAKYEGRIRTTRGIQNKAYMIGAIQSLGFHPEFEWLGLGDKKLFEAGKVTLRGRILEQLGRIKHPEYRLLVASHICRVKPATARLAVAMIRRRRDPENNPASDHREQFANEVLMLVKKFRSICPDFAWVDAQQCLEAVAHQCRFNDYYPHMMRKMDMDIIAEIWRKRERAAMAKAS